MIDFAGRAVAVTGAASGIGRALALEFAARGCDLALSDIDDAGLRSVAEELQRAHSKDVLIRQLDVSDLTAVEEFARESTARFPKLCVVVNNAGVALQGQFEELDLAQIQWLFGINFWGVVYGTHAFLPYFKTQPWAHIVNVSSIFGIIAPPGQCAYSAAKFAVRGFSESVRHELAMNASPVNLSVVHPGGVKTNIARSSRIGVRVRDTSTRAQALDSFDRMARTTPVDAARRIIQGIERNEPRILIGGDARVMDLIQRLRPSRYWAMMARTASRLTRSSKPSST